MGMVAGDASMGEAVEAQVKSVRQLGQEQERRGVKG